MMAIDDSDLIRLDERYVTRKECNKTVDEINEKISQDKQDVAIMKNDLDAIKRILWFIAAGVGTLLISALWRLIVK